MLGPPNTLVSLYPSFHCHVYPYPESEASRMETMSGLQSQIQDLSVVSWALWWVPGVPR